MDKIPCPKCGDFNTCEAMKLLEYAIDIGLEVTSITCPKYKIEVKQEINEHKP